MDQDELYLSSDEESVDAEEIVLEGLRRSRNRTNWRHRGSAMTTTDSLDTEDLRMKAAYYENALAHIASAFAALAAIAKSRLDQNLSIVRTKTAMDYISVATQWLTCCIQRIYLDIEDKLHFVHTVRPLPDKQMRSIEEIPDNNLSETMFGFKTHELRLLKLHWRIPLCFREARNRFTGEESMLVFLNHLRTGTSFTLMAAHIFGGDPRVFTHYVRAIVNHLYSLFYHKITGDSMSLWIDEIDEFREATWDKMLSGMVNERDRHGNEDNWEVHVPFDTFRIFGWLDDTDMETNRPRAGRTVTNAGNVTDLRDTQQAFYK